MTAPLRLQILSDLHRDVWPAEAVRSPDADVLVVAGDVCEGMEPALRYLRAVAPKPFPIVFVAGNHEFYRGAIDEEIVRGRVVAAELGITYLENNAALIGGIRFLGCTLWTDYDIEGRDRRPLVMRDARDTMNDHRLITLTRTPPTRFMPIHALAMHQASRAWLSDALQTPFDGPTVVVTHHCPSRRSIAPQWRGKSGNGAFASDLDDLIAGSGAALFVHGHTHSSFDYTIGATRVVCNPHGYGAENPAFNPSLIVEIPRP